MNTARRMGGCWLAAVIAFTTAAPGLQPAMAQEAATQKVTAHAEPGVARDHYSAGTTNVPAGLHPGTRSGTRQQLKGHRPEALKKLNLQPMARLRGAQRLQLAIGLPLRNRAELDALLQQLYDPASPQYRQFLTTPQFTERFGPTEQDYQAVVAFAEANGFTVTDRHANRMVLSVSAAVADIEKAFHLNMHSYRHPTENRTFYAPDAEPALDLAVPVLHICGLDNFYRPMPKLKHHPAALAGAVVSRSGSGPSGMYIGRDFRNAYIPGSTLTGAGQTVGLLQFDGYLASDITTYLNTAGITTSTIVTNVLLDGFSGAPSGNGGEVETSLDIEMVLSMAPGLAKLIVYEAGPYGNPEDMLNRMTSDNVAKQLSSSWGWTPSPDATADQIFQEMAAQGQTYFNASGDSDAFPPGTADAWAPTGSPYVTQVGGTTLTMTSTGVTWSAETVWNWGNGTGSSGGISTNYLIPSYQQGVSMTANQGSTTHRNIPDVAMTADNVLVIAHGGSQLDEGGTSCAAPLWAGYTALVNQQAATYGKSPVGCLNPAFYTIGQSAKFTNCFHDITTGNNFNSGSPTNFPAVTGYDLCTGWGTPNGINLINALAPPGFTLWLPAAASEGDGVLIGQGSISTTLVLTNDLSVTLASSNTGKVIVPANVVIHAGTTNASFDLTIVDNALLDGTQNATITATAPAYGSASATMAVFDNETAALTLVAPATAQKGQGLLANAGTIFVSAPPATDVAVSLTSSDTNKVVLPPTVTIPAGQTSNAFNVTILDNHLFDVAAAVTLTAHVQNWTDGAAVITVYNNTNLTVTLPASASEGDGVLTNAGSVAIDAPLLSSLLVNLASSLTNRLLVPSSITIAAGQTAAVFNVTIVDNAVLDGTQTATVTASASGFVPGSASLAVKDNDVYQFGLSAIASPQAAGTPFAVSLAALDINGATITVFRTALNLSAAGDHGPVLVLPTATTAFSNGLWTGSVRINTPDTNVRLTADDGAGHSVQSNPFNVLLGPLDHFAWNPIGSPQHQDTPLAATVTAQDAGSNTVTSFTGAVPLSGAMGGGTGSQLLVTEVYVGTPDAIEFVNVSGHSIDISGWQVLIYDYDSGTAPLAPFTVPAGTICQAGDLVILEEYGTAPGAYPHFYTGVNIDWTETTSCGVLLRDQNSNVVDFVAASGLNPAAITNPVVIVPTYWQGSQVSAVPVDTQTYQRFGNKDTNTSNDWCQAAKSIGTLNVGLTVPFQGGTAPVAISPTNTGNFVSGVWSGPVTVLQPTTNMMLVANDGAGHSGTSALFMVTATVDLAVALNATPEPVQVGSNLSYAVTLNNFGPDRAANVMFTDPLPSNVTFVSASVSQGSITQLAGVVTGSLGSLGSGAAATATIIVSPTIQASLTNTVTVANSATDSNPANNSATAVSTVLGTGALAVTPATGLTTSGQVGGPFSPASQVYTLTNSGTGSLLWQASNTTPWVTLSAVSGILAAHASTNVTVSLNAGANSLPAGSYGDSVQFANLTNGNGTTNRPVNLTVMALFVSPASYDFGPVLTGTTAQASFVVSNCSATALSGTAAVTGTFAVVTGGSYSLPGYAASTVTVRFAPLTNGAYASKLVFASTGGTSTNALNGTGGSLPVAAFTGTPLTGLLPLTVAFTDTSTGVISNRFWTFGDGATTNTLTNSVAHIYTAGGSNTVSLQVAGALGASTLIRTNYVVVRAPYINDWLTPSDNYWRGAVNWSLAVQPAPDQWQVQITNAISKTVTLDIFDTFAPSDLTVSNLLLSAPAGTTNTLFMDRVGLANPLHVFNGLTLTGKVAMALNNSALLTDGITKGTNLLDGSIALQGSTLLMTNTQTYLGYGDQGQLTLTNSTAWVRALALGALAGGARDVDGGQQSFDHLLHRADHVEFFLPGLCRREQPDDRQPWRRGERYRWLYRVLLRGQQQRGDRHRRG